MADKQENGVENSNKSQTKEKVAEPKKVEITVGNAENASVTAPAGEQKQDNLSQLTSEIMGALCFDLTGKTDEELRSHNSQLQSLLGKVMEFLKEKSGLCANLEKQIAALTLQSSSLKDVVLITKELLSIRNKEVEHLHEDIKSMEEKINGERERHNNMLNRMSEAVKKHLSVVGIHRGDMTCRLCGLHEETAKRIAFECDALERNRCELKLALDSGQGKTQTLLNENLKTEYQTQLKLFNELRSRYEEKVSVLDSENKRLSMLVVKSGGTSKQQTTDEEGMGEGVQLSLEKMSPS